MDLKPPTANLIRQSRKRLKTILASARQRTRVIWSVVLTLGLLAALSLGSGLWFLSGLLDGLPDGTAIGRIGEMDQATIVLDQEDRPAFTIYKEHRIEIPLGEISPHLVQAIVAIEDQRFYQHQGFDLIRMAAAALADIRHGTAAQGGSTITQQLARQSFLTSEKTIRRKLQELIVARRIERMYSKPRILELYLNKIYFGDGLHGVEAASRGYFGKRASQLSVEEAALIAGLVKSPSSYAPTVSIERAKARRNVVLNAMLETGAIDRAAWQAARSAAVTLHDNLREDEAHGQYFKEQVRLELVDRFGWQRVYQGGLRVFSTIDTSMQQAAEVAVASGLKALDARRKAVDDSPLQAALIAMDPASGHVRAMIGGRDFATSHYNRAVQAERQPGSAFKPFVYAAALEAGFTPATMISRLNEPIETPQGGWSPEDEHSTADEMSLRTGLRTSSNRAAVRLLQEVGIEETVQYASNLGVENMPNVPSLALGSGEVTLQSLTAAYAAFANGGRVPRPLLIRRVEDNSGRVLYAAEDSSRRAISETTAFLMATMMADVINAGTGARARQLGFRLPAAGKTGTTNGFRDAWFVGFTPTLVAGVWVGFDQPRTILRNGFAAEVAVPLWANFMKEATRRDKPAWLAPPPRITTATVCRLSGKLATKGCEDVEVIGENGIAERRSMVYAEYFADGTQPTSYCELHASHGFFGTIVSAFTGEKSAPPPSIQDTGLLPSTATAPVDPVLPTVSTEPPRKKRGFWSRLFGVGKDERSRR
jgi:1A family penicillin-binding protein